MADSTKYYVLKGDKTLAEGMTKEEILTAIVQAVEQGVISDVDTGFVTSFKELNGNQALKFWIGTEAQYQAIAEPEKNVLYLISDDTTENDLEEAIQNLADDIDTTNARIDTINEKAVPVELQDEGVISSANDRINGESSYWSAKAVNGIAFVSIHLRMASADYMPSGAKLSTLTQIATGLPKAVFLGQVATAVGGNGYNMQFVITTNGILSIVGHGDSANQNLNVAERFEIEFSYPYSE